MVYTIQTFSSEFLALDLARISVCFTGFGLSSVGHTAQRRYPASTLDCPLHPPILSFRKPIIKKQGPSHPLFYCISCNLPLEHSCPSISHSVPGTCISRETVLGFL